MPMGIPKLRVNHTSILPEHECSGHEGGSRKAGSESMHEFGFDELHTWPRLRQYHPRKKKQLGYYKLFLTDSQK